MSHGQVNVEGHNPDHPWSAIYHLDIGIATYNANLPLPTGDTLAFQFSEQNCWLPSQLVNTKEL
jgi:hypothetical protein